MNVEYTFIIDFHHISSSLSQVNRIKIPKQLDELVEMDSESANRVSKFFFRIKIEICGVNRVFQFDLLPTNNIAITLNLSFECNESVVSL